MHALNERDRARPFERENKERHKEREDWNGVTLGCSLSSRFPPRRFPTRSSGRSFVPSWRNSSSWARLLNEFQLCLPDRARLAGRAFRLKAAALLSFIWNGNCASGWPPERAVLGATLARLFQRIDNFRIVHDCQPSFHGNDRHLTKSAKKRNVETITIKRKFDTLF